MRRDRHQQQQDYNLWMRMHSRDYDNNRND
jgi:hypothetical protein